MLNQSDILKYLGMDDELSDIAIDLVDRINTRDGHTYKATHEADGTGILFRIYQRGCCGDPHDELIHSLRITPLEFDINHIGSYLYNKYKREVEEKRVLEEERRSLMNLDRERAEYERLKAKFGK